ncbi:MAG: NADH-quinone oxidoreductase subunit N [Pseudomonadota bacterium]
MTTAQLPLLAPLLALAGGAVLIMLQIAVRRSPSAARVLAALTCAVAMLACLGQAPPDAANQVTPLLLADRLALLLSAVCALSAGVITILSGDTIESRSDQPEEYYLLLVLATLGACVLVYANHVASLLLGLELLSLSLYALVAYPSREPEPVEAATKYLVLSGAATAIMLFGFALVYAATGTLSFPAMGERLASVDVGQGLVLPGMAMVLVGLAFKLALAPLHLWTPDVYQGAPSPVSGYLASVAKIAPFVGLLRFFIGADVSRIPSLVEVTAVLAALSMMIGNLLALLQNDLKRMLAYSSIAHVGYLFIVFSAGSAEPLRPLAAEAGIFYLIAYMPTVVAAFAVLTLIQPRGQAGEALTLDSVAGLFWRQPVAATLMLLAMLSLAGIPLTAGFIGKLYIYSAAVAGGHWVLVGLMIIGTGLGIYYYLRVVYQMTRGDAAEAVGLEPGQNSAVAAAPSTGIAVYAVIVGLLAGILALGLLPQRLMQFLSGIF